MNKKHFFALAITLTVIFLLLASVTITLAKKENSIYESFKNYFQEKIIQLSEDESSQLKDFQKLSPIDKFIQASKLHQNQDETSSIDSIEVNDNE